VLSPHYDDGPIAEVGAITLADGHLTGHVDHDNRVIGAFADGGGDGGARALSPAYDFANARLAVGRPASNVVTLMNGTLVFRAGFDEGRVD
jgi:hypothetical protein